MAAGRTDRLWMLAGVVLIAVLVALTYFAGVSPTHASTDALTQQAADVQTQAITVRKEVARLAEEKKKEKALQATRDAYRDALPSGSGVPAFLRQLQAAGTDLGVDVNGVTVGAPVKEEKQENVWSIQIQLTAEGEPAGLDGFLRQLQGGGQKRAVLVEAANLEAGEKPEETRLSLTIRAFVAPAAGAGAPTVTVN
ncbi:hypothetical protein Asp14428_35160 [Actinoplanes sp. NBRC 14428]|uniref:Type IV pilus assembly protein PilO n=1 Tax=Pseudosporangium ferrugineum TaxID=439699 RepID=A0A2T0S396_9ACTN|nr:type 4a pilus biogenesis protein PilO [Pseudosporangium ferrugineum]PRY27906.1 type IV pilus assembly protein PilO [Pseudosporangium ferrugineum]BCJ52041.1 hypothetical protein Asp14428_35160 [Actinoplanes sp. NBRC 14428]